uniref:Cytoplasmic dynein 2 light intermediate chain 1 n=1 Tax=Halisarca dujardinii TaxID=2583056 RepID=A0A9F1UCT2_HALDU|nr:cytoplasmic dynein 2 light intermediate chain [Halisarca dujardinii]
MDIWKVADSETSDLKSTSSCLETTLLFLGNSNAGKTSLVLKFLERDETPKPTMGLEYTFGRRSKGSNMSKQIANIWELGGGTLLTDLINLPVTVDTLSTLSVVVVLDLSKPEELWTVLEQIFGKLRQRVNEVMKEIKTKDKSTTAALQKKAWGKFGKDHPDRDMLDPLPVSLAIIGAKYDLFQSFDPEKKKTICKTLRFLAHIHGASLQFYTMKSDTLVVRTKQLLCHYAFQTSASHTMSMDYTKPLIVPAGCDALGQIGVPPIQQGELSHISAKKPIDLWKQAYCSLFPQTSSSPAGTNPCKDPRYAEKHIDSSRNLKDTELDKTRRSSSRSVAALFAV